MFYGSNVATSKVAVTQGLRQCYDLVTIKKWNCGQIVENTCSNFALTVTHKLYDQSNTFSTIYS